MATKSSFFASKETVRRFMLPTGGKYLPQAALVCLAYFVVALASLGLRWRLWS